MLAIEDFTSALENLNLGNKPAIAHASLRSFGTIQGGAETVLNALLASVSGLMMPTFTYKTMIIPEVGPPNNGLAYGMQRDLNRMAEPFSYDMPVDPLIGTLSERLRHSPGDCIPFMPNTRVKADANDRPSKRSVGWTL